MSYLDEVFGPGGYLAQRFAGYEPRPGQVALAEVVDRAMREGRHMLGEGPCGTGKSVSYCVPATYHASGETGKKRRTVIVTANIALQEQLVEKDLPMLQEILPWRFTFALLKGKNNFYCYDRREGSDKIGYFDDLRRGGFYGDDSRRAVEQLEDLLQWADSTETGDKSELPFVPVEQLWSRVSPGEDDCKGKECRHYKQGGDDSPLKCFFYKAKARAHAVDVIVTNYHVLFAHLLIRDLTGQDIVLPDYTNLVLDEAHEAADIAREFFGFTVSERSVWYLTGYVESHMDNRQQQSADRISSRIETAAKSFFAEITKYGRTKFDTRLKEQQFVPMPEELFTLLRKVIDYTTPIVVAYDERGPGCGITKDEFVDARMACSRASNIIERITETLQLSDENGVYYIEFTKKGYPKLGKKLIDVAETMSARLFDGTESVSLVSATLTTGGDFKFVRREMGLPDDAFEVVAASPFDFTKQALLVVPLSMPAPDASNFSQSVAEIAIEVINACQGRTLCLFTSNKCLDAVYDRLREIPYTLLKQGLMPRTELSRIFKADISSVLLGTNSFWTGIDVPGEALTGLVIDKLPFPNRSDPVVDAICEKDKKWFDNYSKPKAIIMLRQGVGRLIRSQKDVGVIVILDRRLVDKYYRHEFFRSLPPMTRTSSVADIARFLNGESVSGTAPSFGGSKSLFDSL